MFSPMRILLSPLAFALATAFYLFTFAGLPSRAAIFDAADILPENAGAVGGFGELLLSDPTSEGVEARSRFGLTNEWNVGLNLGVGSKSKKFRIGGEAVFNLLPDWDGQLGLSFLGSATYLRRFDTGGLQTRIGPMIHKRFAGWGGFPANIYVALPWYQEIRGSTFTSGTQLVAGSGFDVADAGRVYMVAEAGVKLAKTDSYVLLGVGWRLGELSFKRGDSSKGKQRNGSKVPNRGGGDGGDNYTDEDFQN